MTDITNVILVTSADDGAWMESDHGSYDILYEYLRKNYQGDYLIKVDEQGGGKKRMTCDVFIGAIDYLNREELLETFNAINWQYPDKVQLLLRNSRDNTFKVYTVESLS
ncbi:MAG: hypothetical protein ACRBBW_21520 [Cellvibrionaceae bacterium]